MAKAPPHCQPWNGYNDSTGVGSPIYISRSEGTYCKAGAGAVGSPLPSISYEAILKDETSSNTLPFALCRL